MKNLDKILTMFVVLFIVFYCGYYVIVVVSKVWNETCDLKYGRGNWTVKDTTGTGECRFYIGQCWECVKK